MRISKFLQNFSFFGIAGWMLLPGMNWFSSTDAVNYTQNKSMVLAPANDECATATLVSAFPSTFSGTTVGASDSNSGGTPSDCHPFPASSGGVWFEIEGTGGTIMATTCTSGTMFDTRLAVYSSGAAPGDCNSLSCVTANDDIGPFGGCTESGGSNLSKVEWATTAGVIYYVYLDGFGTTTGVYELFVEETIPAPLTLVKFEGRVQETGNRIQWETISETNTEWHIVERSATGSDRWEEVDRVEAAGFSYQLIAYEIEDTDALGVGYYRLKTYDYDGSVDVTPIIRVERMDQGFQLQRIAPMPFDDILEVQYDSDRNGEALITVFDMAGKKVFDFQQEAEDGANTLYLDLNWLKAGIYLLTIEQEGRRVNERIVKRKY